VRERVPMDEISELLRQPDTLVWIDLTAPQPAALEKLRIECRLHPLAIEDVRQPHQRPKIDEYDNFYFIVFYVAKYSPGMERVEVHEVDLFVGDRFVVTVHQRPVSQIDEAVRRWSQQEGELGYNIGALLYALFDSMVDTYFPVLDAIGEDVDEVQEAIFARPDRRTLRRLSRLRRELLNARRVLAPEREVINTLLRRDRPILPANTAPYFYDIYDHIVRMIDTVDTHREVLSSATDSYLSVTSNNLNEIMKIMTAWSIMLMSASLIASIYGMNFNTEVSPWNMPELNAYFGYPLALLAMLAVVGGLFTYFRRRDWL
jgi:magnesium transporter